MGKIYCIMGKSASGKDTVFRRLLADPEYEFATIVPYTTRPMRAGESDGVEYYFCSERRLEEFIASGKVIEQRAYDTVYGVWKYFTVDDHQIDLNRRNYLIIGTPESYCRIRNYFGKENVLPIYIEVEDGLRLFRALERERREQVPGYEEMCRRFLSDAQDFSREKLADAGITERFENLELERTLAEIRNYIRSKEAEEVQSGERADP